MPYIYFVVVTTPATARKSVTPRVENPAAPTSNVAAVAIPDTFQFLALASS